MNYFVAIASNLKAAELSTAMDNVQPDHNYSSDSDFQHQAKLSNT